MDGQDFGNGQNNNYQDNTANIPYQSTYSYEDNNSGKANGLQIASLVLGIISICLICCYGAPSIILGLIGLILAIMGNKESRHGIGIAGLVCSIIGLAGGAISLVYYVSSYYYFINLVGTEGFEELMNEIYRELYQ